ncbi:uncharacterized protein SCHCODRAFT_02620030 [Schizophyllum commune H4-8]|uniref:uncharacterized protein n=1 Tax=Schizophyllum commune (strain H4-8 / FGSC 9210) TaxID=578458 RepID=UPI00215E1A27|nr:uncharacterized protein SCHCODRAFT_02620030 [Schizophyllum commune H4-8]KAI5895660.1 hypothetical protein SCHCODRAFT_02620030 [Schizophyllum commune H4-8]
MRGDGGHATLEADSPLHLGGLSGIHPWHGPTPLGDTTRQVDSVADTCRILGLNFGMCSTGGGSAPTTRCFTSSSKPAEWR